MRLPIALALLALALSATLQAQVLDVRSTVQLPVLRPGDQARNGEVVLGQTTVTAALRMFAVELRSEMVSLPLAHPANPDTIPSGTVWQVGPHQLRPYRRLELGADRYVLNFDRNDRLISAWPVRVPNGITQPTLAEHYPEIRKGQLWHSGDQPIQEWNADIEACVVLSAMVREATGVVQQLSYNYTCETKPAGK